MKKQLLCTSAIALGVAAAAPASAAEWNLDWGGFMNTHLAIGDLGGNVTAGVDLDGDGFDILQTGEIIFTPSITLDNGLTFGVNVQMEALNAAGGADGIDEAYISISSDTFGQLDIGSENSAGYKSMVAGASTTSLFINSPSISAFIPFSAVLPGNFRQAAISSYTEVGGNNDVNRITYYTPSFNGLTVGVSFAPSGALNANTSGFGVDQNTVLSDIFDIGINYSQTFGNVDVSFGARWGTGDAPSITGGGAATGLSDPETWGVGFQVGVSGFTFGAAYTENDNGAAAGVGDQEGYSIGVAYDAPGPWTFGLETYFGEYTGTGTGAADETYEAYQLGASRSLGSGVTWQVHLTYVEADDEGTVGTDLDGTVLGTSINLSF
ncbi:porin [Roseovarius phycicola]|uniref:Porin n=1 Tax=Roseovarius phycicola TaxID=3080976 RepID=A0ABZ2HNC3_9RHOB